MDPQKWIGWCGFASEDSLGMNNGSGFPSVDLLERIYRDGFAGADPQERIGWGGFALEASPE